MHLFETFPILNIKISHIQFAQLPTPVHKCSALANVLDFEKIYIKRDDLTGFGSLYGGNKVRKLEFLLADALQKNATEVVTFGSVGTNHGLATACYAHQLGLNCLLMVTPQPNSSVVRQNLLLDHYYKAKIELFDDVEQRQQALEKKLADNNSSSYFIPTGGSVPLGTVGYVNAAFELKEQIEQGIIPEPDFIYIPAGSCGTTAGLLLGLVLANLKSTIIAVAIEPEEKSNQVQEKIETLFFESNKMLISYEPEIHMIKFPHDRLIINKDFCGPAYGVLLESSQEAMELIKAAEGIILEGTYSAKAAAALIADIKNGVRKKDEVILFWNTYCGLDFSHLTNSIDYKELNPALHSYF